MKIAIDVMGGDNAPVSNIRGLSSYLSENNDNNTSFFLIGDKTLIEKTLSEENLSSNLISIINANQTIEIGDNIGKIHKNKPDNSIVKSINLLKEKEVDAVISAGNTGALLSSSLFVLDKIEHIRRPALAPCIPSDKGDIIISDAGANINTKPMHMLQYAIMSSEYFKLIHGKRNARVGLINIGVEENKGPELYKETYQLLKSSLKSFVGFIESRDIFNGKVDIVICDGFTGNVMLKLIEGMFGNFYNIIKDKKNNLSDISKEKLLYEQHGGTPLLGINGIVIKCHGSSTSISIKNSISQAKTLYETNLIENILNKTSATLNKIVENSFV